MTAQSRLLAVEARKLVGARFRLHGRDAKTGLDCVGLVLCALGRVRRVIPCVNGYGLRNIRIDSFLAAAGHAGLRSVDGAPQAGDVLLFRISAGQFHLGIVGENGELIHAHAGLQRVVATPPPIVWATERHWRLD